MVVIRLSGSLAKSLHDISCETLFVLKLNYEIKTNYSWDHFLFQVIMLINGQPFTVSTIRNDSLRRLRASAGNCTLLPEFRPVRFPHRTYIWRLLYHGFFCHGICCFLAGNFMLYMAGIFNAYANASLFMALTESPLLRRIFRQDLDPLDNFYIHGFLFEFSGADDDEDIFYYDISFGDFRMSFVFYGIDTTDNCDTFSNLDFVQFIWLNY